MLPLAPVLLTQVDPATPQNFWVSLGVFATTAAALIMWIRYLIAQVGVERAARAAAEEKADHLADRMLELSERVFPSMAEMARVLPMAVEELKRERRR